MKSVEISYDGVLLVKYGAITIQCDCFPRHCSTVKELNYVVDTVDSLMICKGFSTELQFSGLKCRAWADQGSNTELREKSDACHGSVRKGVSGVRSM